MPARSSRYLLDNNVFIAAVKRGWTRSTELVYLFLDSPAELFANEFLIQEEIDACAAFFPESELSDIVHAATCLSVDAVLITNDRHFNKIKEAEIIEVWSSTKAIKRLLEGLEDYEDSWPRRSSI